ncbi:ParB/Srx family N-terminal domain-containing protein [Streptomyces sp. NPDC058067]|uniref:ParB/Srx family N-terminal domain-containing protein n=1 Tax=Streptomyces sp. NPDC058067 TaxID=3346324 RepID=UPI0036E5CCE9
METESTRLAPPQMVQGDPRTLTLLDHNARFLPHEQFRQLVANIERDGHLTSTPLVWNDRETGRLVVLSGNHRTLAAVEAGLSTIWWMQIDELTSRAAYKVGNTATALGVILTVFERHLGELAEGRFNAAAGEPTRKGAVPLETVFGVREIPVETAAVVRSVVDRLVEDRSVPAGERWRALEVLARPTA